MFRELVRTARSPTAGHLPGCMRSCPKQGGIPNNFLKKGYERGNSSIGPSAEIPTYVKMTERDAKSDARWYDMRFPYQRATVHLTYSRVGTQLNALIEGAHEFKNSHGAKALKIGNERVLRDSVRVFGTLYDVEGDVAARSCLLTDSTDNFIYGACISMCVRTLIHLLCYGNDLEDLRHSAASFVGTDRPSGGVHTNKHRTQAAIAPRIDVQHLMRYERVIAR